MAKKKKSKKQKKDSGTNLLAITGAVSIAGVVGYSMVNKLINNVSVDVGNPSIDNTPFLNGYLRTKVPVTITNNNLFSIGISSFYGKVNFGIVQLANVSVPFGFSIPAGTTRLISVDMDIPITEVLNDISLLIIDGSVFDAVLNKIELNGNILIKGRFAKANIPLNNISIPIV